MQIVFTWDRAAAGQSLCSQSRAAPAQPVQLGSLWQLCSFLLKPCTRKRFSTWWVLGFSVVPGNNEILLELGNSWCLSLHQQTCNCSSWTNCAFSSEPEGRVCNSYRNKKNMDKIGLMCKIKPCIYEYVRRHWEEILIAQTTEGARQAHATPPDLYEELPKTRSFQGSLPLHCHSQPLPCTQAGQLLGELRSFCHNSSSFSKQVSA